LFASSAIANLITPGFLFFLYNFVNVITHLTRQLYRCVRDKIIPLATNSFSALMKFSTLTESNYVSHRKQVPFYPAIEV
jgi:hypothetical protein